MVTGGAGRARTGRTQSATRGAGGGDLRSWCLERWQGQGGWDLEGPGRAGVLLAHSWPCGSDTLETRQTEGPANSRARRGELEGSLEEASFATWSHCFTFHQVLRRSV